MSGLGRVWESREAPFSRGVERPVGLSTPRQQSQGGVREGAMQVKRFGFGIRGFYRAVQMGQTLAMKGETAERRLEILRFWTRA